MAMQTYGLSGLVQGTAKKTMAQVQMESALEQLKHERQLKQDELRRDGLQDAIDFETKYDWSQLAPEIRERAADLFNEQHKTDGIQVSRTSPPAPPPRPTPAQIAGIIPAIAGIPPDEQAALSPLLTQGGYKLPTGPISKAPTPLTENQLLTHYRSLYANPNLTMADINRGMEASLGAVGRTPTGPTLAGPTIAETKVAQAGRSDYIRMLDAGTWNVASPTFRAEIAQSIGIAEEEVTKFVNYKVGLTPRQQGILADILNKKGKLDLAWKEYNQGIKEFNARLSVMQKNATTARMNAQTNRSRLEKGEQVSAATLWADARGLENMAQDYDNILADPFKGGMLEDGQRRTLEAKAVELRGMASQQRALGTQKAAGLGVGTPQPGPAAFDEQALAADLAQKRANGYSGTVIAPAVRRYLKKAGVKPANIEAATKTAMEAYFWSQPGPRKKK